MAGLIADRFDSARSNSRIVHHAGHILQCIGRCGAGYNFTHPYLCQRLRNVFRDLRTYIYYALLEETRTPKHLTGASVAVIAFIGYTPEAFFGPVTGRILDANPGVPGHQNFFAFLAAVSVVGILVTLLLIRLNKPPRVEAQTGAALS